MRERGACQTVLGMDSGEGFTPAEVARRVAALGVIVNPATVWAYLRARLRAEHPGIDAPPTLLPVREAELAEWLEDFLDGVEQERARLHDALRRAEGER